LSKKNVKEPPKQDQKLAVSKYEAGKKLDQFQKWIGLTFIASAALGSYLLATDKSLWLLAVSHAYGLIAICAIDVVLGLANLSSVRKVLLPSYGWALLTIFLQLGDIITAPQYKMTVQYFAGYLFGLWAFDGILIAQGLILAIGFYSRSYRKMITKKKKLSYFDMGVKNSRREFLQIGGAIGALLVIAVALGFWDTLTPSATNTGPTTTQITNPLPTGAVANVKNLQVGVPAYFDYPSAGYTNMLMKKSDGSVSALSILCTHVCCQCQFDTYSGNLLCPCHGSIFDKNGNVLRGPALTKLPSVELSIDSAGNIFPVRIVGSGPCVSGS